MTISKQFQTIISGLTLTGLGSLISFWTGWYIIIPILFGLSIPLVNAGGQFRQKFVLTLVSTISSTAILIATFFTLLNFDIDKYIFPGLVVGVAAVLILVLNGFLIDNIKLDIKTILLTFMLSGLTLPTSIYFLGQVFGDSLSDIDSRICGIIFFWLVMTTIAISFGLRKKPTANTKFA